MNLLVVGSVAYDSVETAAGKRDDMLGGSATHFSVSASQFADPGLVAVIGNDFRADDIQLLDNHGVDLSGMTTADGPTFRWGGRYHDDMKGRDTLFTHLNVFETFTPELGSDHRQIPTVFLANIHPGLQHQVLDQVDTPKFVAADTMNLWIDIARDDLIRLLGRLDGLFLNDEEAEQLTGETSVLEAIAALQHMGPKLVVVKRGEHGALVALGSEHFFVPAFPVPRVVDPTGAGDTFAGAFMARLAQQDDFSMASVRQAAVLGTIVASFCVEGFGLERTDTLTLQEIQARYEEFEALTRFERIDLGTS